MLYVEIFILISFSIRVCAFTQLPSEKNILFIISVNILEYSVSISHQTPVRNNKFLKAFNSIRSKRRSSSVSLTILYYVFENILLLLEIFAFGFSSDMLLILQDKKEMK